MERICGCDVFFQICHISVYVKNMAIPFIDVNMNKVKCSLAFVLHCHAESKKKR